MARNAGLEVIAKARARDLQSVQPGHAYSQTYCTLEERLLVYDGPAGPNSTSTLMPTPTAERAVWRVVGSAEFWTGVF